MGLKMNLDGMMHAEIHKMLAILFHEWDEMPEDEGDVLITCGYLDLWQAIGMR